MISLFSHCWGCQAKGLLCELDGKRMAGNLSVPLVTKKIEKLSRIPICLAMFGRRAIVSKFRAMGYFYFSANFFPFSTFGPFATLCQALGITNGGSSRKGVFK